jgi:hypothetical protein
LGKPLHFFQLWAELQQYQISAGSFELSKPLGHLFRRPNQAGPQAAI